MCGCVFVSLFSFQSVQRLQKACLMVKSDVLYIFPCSSWCICMSWHLEKCSVPCLPPWSLVWCRAFSSGLTEPLQTAQIVKEDHGDFPALEEAAWRHFQSARSLMWNVRWFCLKCVCLCACVYVCVCTCGGGVKIAVCSSGRCVPLTPKRFGLYVQAGQTAWSCCHPCRWIMGTSLDELRTQINLGFVVVICLYHT